MTTRFEYDDPQPDYITECRTCKVQFTVPSEGLPATYPCGRALWDGVECERCIAAHIEYCSFCAIAIAESEES